MSDNHSAESVRVVVRVRPLISVEQEQSVVQVQGNNVIYVQDPDAAKKFSFDRIFDSDTKQATVFEEIAKPIANDVMQGYNGTIFAYGQTGSGKTFTMQGKEDGIRSNEPAAKQSRGIIPLVLEYLFERMEQDKSGKNMVNYTVKCSYLQVYNEMITDLLYSGTPHPLNIREDSRRGVYVDGISEEVVQGPQECYQLLMKGLHNRAVGATAMNQESSRSHAVLTLTIERNECKENKVWTKRVSKLNLVDLAGSERQKKTNTTGKSLKEAANINRSLSVLGYVIMALVDVAGGRERHINYRDSKLTFLLRDSLGGNAKTCIIATISPSEKNISETISTLKFAQRAKCVKNRATIQEETSGNVMQLQVEIKRLQEFVRQLLSEREQLVNHSNQSTPNGKAPALVTVKRQDLAIHSPPLSNEESNEGQPEPQDVLVSGAAVKELQQMLILTEQRGRETEDTKRYLETQLEDITNQYRRYKDSIRSIHLVLKKVVSFMQEFTPQGHHERMNSEVIDMDSSTVSSSGSVEEEEEEIQQLEETAEYLQKGLTRFKQFVETKKREVSNLREEVGEKQNCLSSLRTQMEQLTSATPAHSRDHSQQYAYFRSQVIESIRTNVDDDSFQPNLWDPEKLADVEFLQYKIAEILQSEAYKDELIQGILAEKARIESQRDAAQSEVDRILHSLEIEKENSKMLEDQLKKMQNNQDHQGIGEEALRKKLIQSESKIQSLENFRKQMQRLVDQQSIEIQTWKKRAQSVSEELVAARKEYENHERSRSEQLQRLMNELIKQRRQIILAEERIAAASVIQKEIQQHFDQGQYLREGRGGAISSFVNGLEYIAEQVISKLFGATRPNNPHYGLAGSVINHSKDIPLETMTKLGGELEQSAKAAEAALSRMDHNIELFSHSRSSSKDASETITV
ncbi:Kinesin-like protein KIF15-B [Galdieria sulphuraria]|uniref:Kinesin-like protein n=1 Tax=Galdieria sulphuraria TaxID=130081 RepID=M2X2I2_GALSU|nr:kinesin family member [Galdieria sulphuraria]EME30595.1 kinesin family member [Galdieria sulphuraria]GJD08992.1 Kinesin-like protein KIF15-B [Galdieria sulphuraria]|eukprot:XP_005707115.1 kinesin family member [Galdieria sulphuraria]